MVRLLRTDHSREVEEQPRRDLREEERALGRHRDARRRHLADLLDGGRAQEEAGVVATDRMSSTASASVRE
jgi:hypothetical protein